MYVKNKGGNSNYDTIDDELVALDFESAMAGCKKAKRNRNRHHG